MYQCRLGRILNAPVIALLGACLCISLSACGADSFSGSSGEIAKACKKNTNMPSEACKCLAEGAEERLSEPAQTWLATALSGDTAAAVKIKDEVPFTELIAASTFLMNFSQQCAIPESALSGIQ